MSIVEGDDEKVHYIHSFFEGKVSTESIRQCLNSTSINVEHTIELIATMLSEQKAVATIPRKNLSLNLSSPQHLDGHLKVLSPKTPFLHPEYPSINMSCCGDQMLGMQALQNYSVTSHPPFNNIPQGSVFTPIQTSDPMSNTGQMDRTKIYRKKAYSLNPEEREALENLIENVIIDGGVDDTTSEEEDDATLDSIDQSRRLNPGSHEPVNTYQYVSMPNINNANQNPLHQNADPMCNDNTYDSEPHLFANALTPQQPTQHCDIETSKSVNTKKKIRNMMVDLDDYFEENVELVSTDNTTSPLSLLDACKGFGRNTAQLAAAEHEIYEMKHSINAAEFVPKIGGMTGIEKFSSSSASTSPTPRSYIHDASTSSGGSHVMKSKSTENLVDLLVHHHHHHHHPGPPPHPFQHHQHHNHPHQPPSGFLHPADPRYPQHPSQEHPRFMHPGQVVRGPSPRSSPLPHRRGPSGPQRGMYGGPPRNRVPPPPMHMAMRGPPHPGGPRGPERPNFGGGPSPIMGMYRSPRGIRISSSSSSPGGGGGGGGAGGSSGANPAGPTASGQSPKQSRRYWTPEDNAVRNRIGTLIHQGKKVMVIVRGLPGSGKSTLANELRGNGAVISIDDFFMRGIHYEYDNGRLPDAIECTHSKAREMLERGINPVIIANTNCESWEMQPYVTMSMKANYIVEFVEPTTPWRFKPKELAKRCIHGVSNEKIRQMLERYESGITIERVLERAAKAKRGIVESNVFKEVKTTGGHASSPQTSASNESSSAGTEAEKRPRRRRRCRRGAARLQEAIAIPEEEDLLQLITTPNPTAPHPDSIVCDVLNDNNNSNAFSSPLPLTERQQKIQIKKQNKTNFDNIFNEIHEKYEPDFSCWKQFGQLTDVPEPNHNKPTSPPSSPLSTQYSTPVDSPKTLTTLCQQSLLSSSSTSSPPSSKKSVSDNDADLTLLRYSFSELQIDINSLRYALSTNDNDVMATVNELIDSGYTYRHELSPIILNSNQPPPLVFIPGTTATVAEEEDGVDDDEEEEEDEEDMESALSDVNSNGVNPNPIGQDPMEANMFQDTTSSMYYDTSPTTTTTNMSPILTLNPSFLHYVSDKFGDLQGVDKNKDYDVMLPNYIAEMIHNCLGSRTPSPYYTNSQAAYTSYLEDKNVEKHFMRNNNTDESLMFLNSDIPLNSSIGLNIAGSPLVSLQNSKWDTNKECIESLKEIMEEQMILEQSKRDFDEKYKRASMHLSTKLKQDKLTSMFPMVDSIYLQNILQTYGYNLELASKVISKLLDDQEYSANQNNLLVLENNKEEVAVMDNSRPLFSDPSVNQLTVDNMKAEILEYEQLRSDDFRKARYSTSVETAMFYHQEAREKSQKIKEMRLNCAESMVQMINPKLESSNEIDLHGLTVLHALDIVERILEDRSKRQLSKHITLVTGRGSHSQGGLMKLKPAIRKYLHENNFKFIEPDLSTIKVTLKCKKK